MKGKDWEDGANNWKNFQANQKKRVSTPVEKKAPEKKKQAPEGEKKGPDAKKRKSDITTGYASRDALAYEGASVGKGGQLTNLAGTSRNQFHERGLPTSIEDFKDKLQQFVREAKDGNITEKQNALIHLGDMFKWLRDAKAPHAMDPHQTELMEGKVSRGTLRKIADFAIENGLDLNRVTSNGNSVRHFYPEGNQRANILETSSRKRINELNAYFGVNETNSGEINKALLEGAREVKPSTLSLHAYLGEMKDLYESGKALYDKLGLGPKQTESPVTISVPQVSNQGPYTVQPTVSNTGQREMSSPQSTGYPPNPYSQYNQPPQFPGQSMSFSPYGYPPNPYSPYDQPPQFPGQSMSFSPYGYPPNPYYLYGQPPPYPGQATVSNTGQHPMSSPQSTDSPTQSKPFPQSSSTLHYPDQPTVSNRGQPQMPSPQSTGYPPQSKPFPQSSSTLHYPDQPTVSNRGQPQMPSPQSTGYPPQRKPSTPYGQPLLSPTTPNQQHMSNQLGIPTPQRTHSLPGWETHPIRREVKNITNSPSQPIQTVPQAPSVTPLSNTQQTNAPMVRGTQPGAQNTQGQDPLVTNQDQSHQTFGPGRKGY